MTEVKQRLGTDIAREHAERFCAKNPGWQMICDIPNGSDRFYETWDDLPAREKRSWQSFWPGCAEEAYQESSGHRCKIPFGFIGQDGEFYKGILDVPRNVNIMMVFKTDEFQNWKKRK